MRKKAQRRKQPSWNGLPMNPDNLPQRPLVQPARNLLFLGSQIARLRVPQCQALSAADLQG